MGETMYAFTVSSIVWMCIGSVLVGFILCAMGRLLLNYSRRTHKVVANTNAVEKAEERARAKAAKAEAKIARASAPKLPKTTNKPIVFLGVSIIVAAMLVSGVWIYTNKVETEALIAVNRYYFGVSSEGGYINSVADKVTGEVKSRMQNNGTFNPNWRFKK